MAVLVECISVIVRRDRITEAYAGGWQSFLDDVPNSTLCYDDEVARVGFLGPEKVQGYIKLLEERGLVFLKAGKPIDIAVVDQQQGFTLPCDWLEFARLPFGDTGGKVGWCWLYEDRRFGAGVHFKGKKMSLVTPPGWEYESSLSAEFTFVPIRPGD